MKPKDGLTRRDLIKNAGLVGAAAVTGGLVGPIPAAAQAPQVPARWDREADVVIIGSGATGMPAAIVAREAGSSVIVVDANRDIGGHAICSGANIPLGGGTSVPEEGRHRRQRPTSCSRTSPTGRSCSPTARPTTATTTRRSSGPLPTIARRPSSFWSRTASSSSTTCRTAAPAARTAIRCRARCTSRCSTGHRCRPEVPSIQRNAPPRPTATD